VTLPQNPPQPSPYTTPHDPKQCRRCADGAPPTGTHLLLLDPTVFGPAPDPDPTSARGAMQALVDTRSTDALDNPAAAAMIIADPTAGLYRMTWGTTRYHHSDNGLPDDPLSYDIRPEVNRALHDLGAIVDLRQVQQELPDAELWFAAVNALKYARLLAAVACQDEDAPYPPEPAHGHTEEHPA
jgi:hypothetical protein